MKLSELLEKDKENFISKLVQAKSADKAQLVVEAQMERILYMYNESSKSDSLKQAASNMLHTARISAALIDTNGDIDIWEKNEKESDQKKRSFLFWPLIVIGVLAGIYMMINIFAAAKELDLLKIIAPFAITAIAMLLAGIILEKPKKQKKKSKNEKSRKIEVSVDSEKIYRAVYNTLILIDKNLEENE